MPNIKALQILRTGVDETTKLGEAVLDEKNTIKEVLDGQPIFDRKNNWIYVANDSISKDKSLIRNTIGNTVKDTIHPNYNERCLFKREVANIWGSFWIEIIDNSLVLRFSMKDFLEKRNIYPPAPAYANNLRWCIYYDEDGADGLHKEMKNNNYILQYRNFSTGQWIPTELMVTSKNRLNFGRLNYNNLQTYFRILVNQDAQNPSYLLKKLITELNPAKLAIECHK